MNPAECRNAYTKVFEEKTYRGQLLSLLSRDECVALQDASLASLPSDTCKRKHRYRSKGTGLPAYVNAITQDLAVECLGPCRQRTLKWCHGMMPNKALDILAGVEGDLKSSFRKGLTSLCNSSEVHLPPGYEDLSPYVKGIATFHASAVMTGPGQATGLSAPIVRWCMINELQSQFDQTAAGNVYDCSSVPFASWAGPALNSVLSTRARKDRPVRQTKFPSFEAHMFEDALYGACSYDRQPLEQLADSRPDAFDEISYSAGYTALASFVWGANAHLDLLRGQVDQDPATHLPEHWYARVWHDALFGESAPEELYRWTARTKDHGSFTGDRDFTECQSDCSCPERYHKYGLGATLFWARETWCGVSCPSAPFDVWMLGSFVDGVRAILHCGEGKHSPAPERTASAALPVRKACIGGIAQVRCQITHLLVWCAIDQRSKTPRALAKKPKSCRRYWGFVCKPIGIVKRRVAALKFAKKSILGS
ncbi:hypothetical protein BO79DRAFT_279857 [Aspergillus costaricaensis CBS 115574]|uniref:Uncharacterized protein n=1 Tax=Aspergillus costaricaensis CBS 115574 TaxID=1448317 RepID=A0ACD1IM78_9EURO|nr:hypothetical protein BO79DRAFT_279857 [Aspergillus costaricaensis CBS 115574]RAK91619.1 hypothetical protein BO79DRAFT_279857 [Aspergillus costaricaensis CBS 115574]